MPIQRPHFIGREAAALTLKSVPAGDHLRSIRVIVNHASTRADKHLRRSPSMASGNLAAISVFFFFFFFFCFSFCFLLLFWLDILFLSGAISLLKWENGFDSALQYYQYALIHALRYNRFLLDEVLSGRELGTPLQPLIPSCLSRGKEGRRMLLALRDWWREGNNEKKGPNTISPIPEELPLLEAERIARRREPGEGLHQVDVEEQLSVALAKVPAD